MLLFFVLAAMFGWLLWVAWRDRGIFFGDDPFYGDEFYGDEFYPGCRHAPQRNASVCDHTRVKTHNETSN